MANLVPFNKKRSDILSSGFSDFQNMIDDFFSDGWPFRRSLAGDTFKIDVQDNEREYVVEAEIPGASRDEINISLDEGRLTIAVTKQDSSEEKNKNYIHRERRYSSMARNVFLADSAPEGIKARLDNGILFITVPKKEKPDRTVKIDID